MSKKKRSKKQKILLNKLPKFLEKQGWGIVEFKAIISEENSTIAKLVLFHRD